MTTETRVTPLRAGHVLKCSGCKRWFGRGEPIHRTAEGAYCAACIGREG